MTSHAGAAVAVQRKIAGLSQRQLADRMNYSLSMLNAVEQGREPASPGFLSAAAKQMRITPELLTGAPYDDGKPLSDAMNGLSVLLTEGRYARAVEPGPLPEIEADLETAMILLRADRTRQAAEMLPDLIRRIHGLLRETSSEAGKGQAYTLLTYGYILAERTARRTGRMSLTLPALDLADAYGPLADDPNYSLFAVLSRARTLIHYGESEVAATLIDQAIGDSDGSAGVPELAGAAHLAGAVNEARKFNYPNAIAHIQAARGLAARTGETDTYMTAFGPLNVEIHANAIELEAGDPHRAALEGSKLTYSPGMIPTRVGHHWQDVARAWLMSGKPDKALTALNKARAVAPQQTRLHPAVRETLYGIAAAERRRTETLTGFATWLGTTL